MTLNLEKTNISIVSDELRKILLQSDIDLLRPAENGPERKLSSKLMIDHSSLNCRRYLAMIEPIYVSLIAFLLHKINR